MAMNSHDAIERDRAIAIPAPDLVKEYRRYAAGDHAARLTAEQHAYAGALIAHPTVDNACDLVLATAASALQFLEYRVEVPAVQDWLDAFAVKNGLADLQTDVHYRCLRDGDHYLGLAWTPERQSRTPVRPADVAIDEQTGILTVPGQGASPPPAGRVTVHHEPAWDGETGMFVGYDSTGAVAYACKDFVHLMGDPPRPRQRRVIYYPDRIERWIADGAGWAPYTLPGEETAIVPWTKRDGRPLGVPVVHFPYGRFGRSPYGASDLAGILGLQDHLNAAVLDLAASAQISAFPMLKVRGIDPKDSRLFVGPGRILGSANPDSDVEMMSPGDLGQIQGYHQTLLAVIARNTATPQHVITGEWPSGSAIFQARHAQIAKVERLAKTVGPAWATLAHRATELANAFSTAGLDEDALITAIFAPPEQLDAVSEATVAKLRAEAYATLAQIDDATLMVKTGLVDEAEAQQIITDRDTRAANAPVVAAF